MCAVLRSYQVTSGSILSFLPTAGQQVYKTGKFIETLWTFIAECYWLTTANIMSYCSTTVFYRTSHNCGIWDWVCFIGPDVFTIIMHPSKWPYVRCIIALRLGFFTVEQLLIAMGTENTVDVNKPCFLISEEKALKSLLAWCIKIYGVK